jgi:hypothetical protein
MPGHPSILGATILVGGARSLQEHWERVYSTKRTDEVSGFRAHLETSLELIRRSGAAPNSPIVDAGGGASTLVDDLLDAGYSDLTIVDVSQPLKARATGSARGRQRSSGSRPMLLRSIYPRATSRCGMTERSSTS